MSFLWKEQKLWEYADQGDKKSVLSLINRGGIDINEGSCPNDSPLLHAVHKGHYDIARILVTHGADVNKGIDEYGSPLVKSVYDQQIDLAELMVAKGIDVNKGLKGYPSALACSIINKQPDLSKMLIDHRANVNQVYQDKEGHKITALHLAAKYNQVDTLKELLDNGAKNMPDCNISPLELAVDAGNRDIVKELIAHEAVSSSEISGCYWKAREAHHYDLAQDLYWYYRAADSDGVESAITIKADGAKFGPNSTYIASYDVISLNDSNADVNNDFIARGIDLMCVNAHIKAGHAVYLDGQVVNLYNANITAPDIYLPTADHLVLEKCQLHGNIHHLSSAEFDASGIYHS
jgi:ankyrin repeat protein